MVYVDRALEGENGDVIVGNAGLRTNTGFTGINDAANVSITDAKKIVLIGEKGNAEFNLIESTSTPIVRGGATLELGSLGLADGAQYSGKLAAVSLGETGETGNLNVVAGNYTVDTITARNSGSAVSVGSGATLNSSNIYANAGAGINNSGTLDVSGNVEATGSGRIENSGEMSISGELSAIGTVINSKNLTIGNGLQVTGGVINTGKLDVTGDTSLVGASNTFTNSGTASLKGDLTIAGTLENSNGAFLETNKMLVSGVVNNYGEIEASDTSEVYGTLTNTGTIELYDTVVGQRGAVNNTHTITGVGTITVNGLLSNVSNADFTGENLILTTVLAGTQETATYAAGVPSITNEASMDFDNITVGNGTEFYNYGTSNADKMVVEEGGYYLNGKKVSTSGITTFADAGATDTYRQLEISGQYTNAGDSYIGTATVTETGTISNTGNFFSGESDQFVDGTGMTIAAGGQLLNSGTAVLASSLQNAGTISGDGSVTFKHGGLGTNVFENTGTIDVGTFATDGEITYNQSGADSSFTADNGWFTGATINVSEGTMSHQDAGSGNTYNLGVQGDAVIANQATVSFGTIDSNNVFNIYTGSTLKVENINLTENEKTVNLLGGTLSTTLDQIFGDIRYTALDIDADTPEDLVDVEGVEVATGVGDMKDSISQGILFGWGTVAFDDAVYSAGVVSDVLTKLDENDLPIGGHEGAGVEGGLQVTFNGQASQNFNVDLANGVKARPSGSGEAFGSAYAVFAGETLTNTTQANSGYTALYVGSADQATVAGVTDANILDNNIGFKQVVNAAGGMTVADDRHFVLVGENQSVVGDFELIDGNLSIVRDGLVTLGTYGTQEATKGALHDVALDNGTLRVRHGDFTAENVTNNGTIYIGGDGAEHGGEILREDTESSLTVDSYTAQANSELLNWGTFAVGNLTSAGQNSGSLTNYGLLDVGTANIDMLLTNLATAEFDSLTVAGGTLTNGAAAAETNETTTLNAAALTTADGSIVQNYATVTTESASVSGRFRNMEDATADLGALTVAGKGLLDNAGEVIADALTQTGGTVQNAGELTISSGAASSVAATITNSGTFTVEAGNKFSIVANGSVTNTGTFESAADISIEGGTLTQDSATEMTLGNVSIADGKFVVTDGKSVSGSGELSVNKATGEAAVENAGTIDFDTIDVAQGSVTGNGTLGSGTSTITVGDTGSVDQSNVNADSLTNSGSLTADNVTIAGSGTNEGDMSLSASLDGDLVNNGQLTIEGGEEFTLAGGTLTNNGTLTATEDVTIDGGHIVQASDTTAVFEDLQIESGDLTVNADKTVEGNQLIIRSDAADSVAVINNGTIDFNRINVEVGSVTGNGTLGSADSYIGVFGDSSVTQNRVEGHNVTVANGASITATDFVSHTDVYRESWNEGVINAVNADFGGRFDNHVSGEITVSDSMTGNLTNIGSVIFEGENGLTFTDGKLTNNGTLAATEKVTIGSGAEIAQISKTEATFTDLLVQGGLLSVSTDRVVSGDSLKVEMASGTDAGVTNSGTIDFGSINVEQGQITGSGTLGSETSAITVGANGSVTQNKVIGESIGNAGSITGNVTADHGTNSGSIVAGDFTTKGQNGTFVNTGSITTSGSAVIAGLDNRNEVTFGNGATFNGGNVNTGTITVNGGKLDVALGDNVTSGNGNLTVNAGLDVGADGKLTIEGPDAIASITGGAAIDGTLTSSGNTTIDKITSESKGNLVAGGGKLNIGDLTDTDGMTFTQTADTELSIDKGWFENSTINIEGGHFDASVIKDDEGNASGMLGNNTVNIGKAGLPAVEGPDSELPSADKVDWAADYVTVKVDTITSDTIINVNNGGVLDVDNINLTPEDGSGATVTIGTGGGLQTSLDQIFEKVSTSVIKVDAVDPETGIVDIITDVIATTTVTDVKDSIKNGLTFENGSTVAWDDDDWSIELVASVANSLTQAGLIDEDHKVQQHFLGDFMGDFTVDTAHRLQEEQEALDQSFVLDPGIVFDTTTLHNVTQADQDANRGLVIGGPAESGENSIDYSIGFKDVANADYVDVEGGKEFVLVGETRPEDFDWTTDYTDDNKLLTDAADGGTINVNDGTFTMGSDGLVESTVGWIQNVNISADGSLVTKNGEFAAWEVANAGAIDITAGSILHTNNVTNSGTIHVAGGFTSDNLDNRGGAIETEADSVSNIGNIATDASSSITNAGTIEIGALEDGKLQGSVSNTGADSVLVVDADMQFEGTLNNEGTASYKDVTIADGTWTNSGYEQGDILTVANGSSHTNTGTSVWNGVTIEAGASGQNGADLGDGPKGNDENFTSDSILYVGSEEGVDDAWNIAGDYVNNGIIQAENTENTNVTGSITNNGQAVYDDMTVTGEGASSINIGYEQGDILTVTDGATHTNTGTSVWNGMTIGADSSSSNGEEIPEGGLNGNDEGFTSDSIVYVGSEEGQNDVFDIAGSYVNNGIIQAENTENTNVTGSITNNGQAVYDDMTVTGEGTSSINIGYEQGDILTVADGATHTNEGTSVWNNVSIGTGSSASNGAELGDGPKGNEEGFTSDSVLVVGSADDDNNTFVIDGNYDNHGVIDASETEKTTVAGDLTNDGQAVYDDMTVENGGSSDNSGYEQGDILNVADGSSHTNTGTSIWNNVTIGEGSTGTNGEALAPDAPKGHEEGFESDSIIVIGSADDENNEFVIDGGYSNNGKLDASETETTTVAGDLDNVGQAWYDDMTVENGGSSDNQGYEKGDILTVEEGGEHTNSGTSIWNNVNIAGSGTNDGSLAVGGEGGGDEFVIGGDYTNNGTLDASDAENTVVAGDLDNNGKAGYDDMDINDGGHSTNDNYEQGDILDVNNGGVWDQNGESHWNNVNVNEGGTANNTGDLTVEDDLVIAGDFNNTGDVTTGDLTIEDGGVLDLGDGSIDAGTTTVNGGDIIVGNHKELADENRVDYDTVVNGPINGHFWVIGNGDLSFGKDADKLAESLGVSDIPDVHNRLSVTQTVTIGESGSIAVGSDVWTDKDNHKDVGDGNLYFGSDSYTVIDSSIMLDGSAAFTGTADGATVTVEDGATLVLGNLEYAGDYVITSGFETAGNTDASDWLGGWTEDALLAPVDAGSGLKWELSLGWDETKIWVNAKLEDIRNKFPDISVPDNVNDSLESCRDAGGPDQILACTVIRNPDLTDEEKTRIINSVAEIGYAAGAMAMAFNEATQAADSIEGRLSMKGEAFNADGSMKDGTNGTGLWVDVLGSWTNADSYSATGNSEFGYDADSYGFIMGFDHKLKDKNVILGGAFSYTDGSLTSTGDLLETKNSFKTFGLHAYGAWKPSERTNLVGTLSYLRSSSEAAQKLPTGAGFGSASADIDTDLFVAGLRGELLFTAGKAQIVPHAGVRMIVGSTDDYDTKLDGHKAYGNSADTTTTFQVPIGVAVRTDIETKEGWKVRPVADVSVIPQFGDTEQDTAVTGTSGVTDDITGEFTGDFATAVSVGFQVESPKDTTIGFRYGLTAGGEGRKDHQLKFEFRKLF